MPTRKSETDPVSESGRRDVQSRRSFLLTFLADFGIVKPRKRRKTGLVFVIGGVNMDIAGTPEAGLRTGDSNPGRVSLRFAVC